MAIMQTFSTFLFVQADGRALTRQERSSDFEKGADLSAPDYLVIGYCWIHEGNRVDLMRNQDSVLSATPLPDGSGILVEQSYSKFGPDNMLVLNPHGSEQIRLINPYPGSPDFKPGDQARFSFPRAFEDRVVIGIEVSRPLPGKPYQWTPHYECAFDTSSWKLIDMKWVDSRAW